MKCDFKYSSNILKIQKQLISMQTNLRLNNIYIVSTWEHNKYGFCIGGYGTKMPLFAWSVSYTINKALIFIPLGPASMDILLPTSAILQINSTIPPILCTTTKTQVQLRN